MSRTLPTENIRRTIDSVQKSLALVSFSSTHLRKSSRRWTIRGDVRMDLQGERSLGEQVRLVGRCQSFCRASSRQYNNAHELARCDRDARINSFPNFTVEIKDNNAESFQIHFVALFSQAVNEFRADEGRAVTSQHWRNPKC